MATVAQSVPSQASRSAWFWHFLREELRPYPGRGALVARMMVAVTLSMIITMIFRVPQGAFAALYALSISRESPRATVAATKTVAIGFVIAAAYVLIGAVFFVSDPVVRFVWVILTFFIIFYCLSALTNYTAGVRFGYLVVVTTPLWDQHVSAEARVEGTLWAVWAITLATVITAFVEVVYADLNPGGDLIRPIAERLSAVEELALSYAESRPIDETTEKNITRLSLIGMSQLRRNLLRSSYSSQYREQMGAVIVLVARVLDIAANLVRFEVNLSDRDRERMRSLAQTIAALRADLLASRVPHQTELHKQSEVSTAVPFLHELETTVSLIPGVFAGSQSLSEYAPSPPGHAPRAKLFRPDALSNSEHIKFGLKGGLAASLCYIIYNVVDWPGISTAVATCLVTALTTIGASRQQQILRMAGGIAGGLLGIGALVFILPHLDSIQGFTVLFLAVTFIAAWFATASSRISYFGVQVALAFYLMNLQEFKIQRSLAVARDRVVGVLLGLSIMWLVFDQLWGAPCAVEMKRTFISNLRLIAEFAREPFTQGLKTAIERTISLRETINTNLDKVRHLADGVLLEFGPAWQQNLALRNRIREWQTQLRMIFIARGTLVKYRLRLPGFELPEPIWRAQHEFDEELAKTLDAMADRLEGKAGERNQAFEDSFKHLEEAIEAHRPEESEPGAAEQLQTFVMLSRRMESLTVSLDQKI